MNTKPMLLAALLAAAFGPAMAREAADGAPAAVRIDAIKAGHVIINGVDAGNLQAFQSSAFAGPLMGMRGKPVKNAPYSAQALSEQTQTLTDGNQIASKTSSMSYRDSAGRTRQEVRDAGGAVRSVTINDAVEGVTYILNPDTKSATRIDRISADKARARAEQLRKDGAAPREEIIVKRVERKDGEAGQPVRENVRIQISKELAAGHPMPGLERLERLGPMIAGAFGDMKWSTRASTKDLGSKEIDGIKAQGKLLSYEIPAGEIGNRNPIVVSTETWFSPELQVTLLSRRSDPRVGERTYRLAGIRREEPPAALFAVPSDYTVKESMATIKKKMEETK
jgi:hypothetical protein